MESIEFEKLDKVDCDHWFYSGKRMIARYWIERLYTLSRSDLLVDGGMGTARWACEMCAHCRVIGLDLFQESIELAGDRIRKLGGLAVRGSLTQLPLPDECASVVTLFDVLEHLPDPEKAYGEALRIARPGGLIVITVPALQWLWSDWDVSLHHYRRYYRSQLRRLLQRNDAKLVRCVYTNTFALPAMLVVRALRKIFPPTAGLERAEDKIPSSPLNQLLRILFVRPAQTTWWRPPLGASLLAIVQKRAAVDADRETTSPRAIG